MTIYFKKLGEDGIIPTKATRYSAGFDLYSPVTLEIQAGETKKIFTDIQIILPFGSYGQILDRSSMALKGLHIRGGVIDSDYFGNVAVILTNFSHHALTIDKGDRFAQIVVHPLLFADIQILPSKFGKVDGERQTAGFGSSGQ